MMKILRLLVGFIGVVIVVAFAVANRAPIDVSFAPLPVLIELPVYGVFLLGLVLGALIGGFAIWIGDFGERRQARRLRNKVWALENQLNVIKQQEEQAQAQGQPPRAGGAMVPSPS